MFRRRSSEKSEGKKFDQIISLQMICEVSKSKGKNEKFELLLEQKSKREKKSFSFNGEKQILNRE